jgi:hypothetical protein
MAEVALGPAIIWSDVSYNLVLGEGQDSTRSTSRPKIHMAVFSPSAQPNRACVKTSLIRFVIGGYSAQLARVCNRRR